VRQAAHQPGLNHKEQKKENADTNNQQLAIHHYSNSQPPLRILPISSRDRITPKPMGWIGSHSVANIPSSIRLR